MLRLFRGDLALGEIIEDAQAVIRAQAHGLRLGFFPSGLIVNIADPKAVKPFTGGAGEKLAFLMGDHETDGVEDRAGAFLFHGSIRTGLLPVSTNLPATAPNGFYFTAGV